jgi:uncharacterized protein (TIGR00251 family)
MENITKAIKIINDEIILFVKISPNSKKNQIIEIVEYKAKFYLKIKIKEVALENKANRSLLEYISKILNISKSSIFIDNGETQSYKSLKIKALSINDVQNKILNYIKEHNNNDIRKQNNRLL